MKALRKLAMVLIVSAVIAGARPVRADPPSRATAAETQRAATPPTRREVPESTEEGYAIPDAARVALGIGAMGTIIGLVSIPNADTERNGPATTLTLISFGVGVTGLATAGVIIWTTPSRQVAVGVGPGAVELQASF